MAQSTAIQDRLILTTSEVENWLGIALGSGGTVLALVISATKQLSDLVCNNFFLDSDENELPIPDGVKIGVLQLIAKVWNSQGTNPSEISGTITKKKAGDLEIQYSDSSEIIHNPIFMQMAYNTLSYYRIEPGF